MEHLLGVLWALTLWVCRPNGMIALTSSLTCHNQTTPICKPETPRIERHQSLLESDAQSSATESAIFSILKDQA